MSSRRFTVLATALALSAPALLTAQTGLRDLLTNFLQQGITLAPPPLVGGTSHVAHFNSLDQTQFLAVRQFNEELAVQLSSFPLASSAGASRIDSILRSARSRERARASARSMRNAPTPSGRESPTWV